MDESIPLYLVPEPTLKAAETSVKAEGGDPEDYDMLCAAIKKVDPVLYAKMQADVRKFNRAVERDAKKEVAAFNRNIEQRVEAITKMQQPHTRRRVVTDAIDTSERGERRHKITALRQEFLDAVLKVLQSLKPFWPVSERQIHYNLLNAPPDKNSERRGPQRWIPCPTPRHPDGQKNVGGTRYENRKRDSEELSLLCTAGRVEGFIEWDSIDDETRPITICETFPGADAFVKAWTESLLQGYRRDPLQSQSDYVELWVEKNTIANILKPVAEEFGMTMTSGRGYGSFPPRRDLAYRYARSKKQRMILIMVSDFDPDGEDLMAAIPHSMEHDLHVDGEVVALKAALKREQTTNLIADGLPPKESSPRYNNWVKKYGPRQLAYELEAVDPGAMQALVRDAIKRTLNMTAVRAERKLEAADLIEIETRRTKMVAALNGADRVL